MGRLLNGMGTERVKRERGKKWIGIEQQGKGRKNEVRKERKEKEKRMKCNREIERINSG